MKKIVTLIALAFGLQQADAQRMSSLFAAMPDTILPMLTKVNRLDCIDFMASNMPAIVQNIFDGKSEMKALTENYLLMNMTSQSNIEMKVLPVNDSASVICMVTTFMGPGAESEIRFYDTSWKRLDANQYLLSPNFNSFWIKSDTCDANKLAMIKSKVEIPLIRASLSPLTADLVFTLSLDDLPEESRKQIEPYLLPKLSYHWTQKKFLP